MRVQAVLQSGSNRVVLVAETPEEKVALGVIGRNVVARVVARYDGHESYGRIADMQIILDPAPPAQPA